MVAGISESAVQILTQHSFIALVLGAFVGGDIFILAAAFLAGRHVFSISEVLLFSGLGALGADLVWFAVGRAGRSTIANSRAYQALLPGLHRLSHRSPLLELIIIKYLIGARLVLMLHMAHHIQSFARFIMYDLPAVTLWLLLLSTIGWLAAQGFEGAVPAYQKTISVLGATLFLFLIISFIKRKYKK